jgi:hypothetical protein
MIGKVRVDLRYVSPGDINRILAENYALAREYRAAAEVGWGTDKAVNSTVLRQATGDLSIKQVALLLGELMGTPALAAVRSHQPVPVCNKCHSPEDQRHQLRTGCQAGGQAEQPRYRRRTKGPEGPGLRSEAAELGRWQERFPFGHRLLVPRRIGQLHLEHGEDESDGTQAQWTGEGEMPCNEALVNQASGKLMVYTDGSGLHPTGGRAGVVGSGMVFCLDTGNLVVSDAVPEGLPQAVGTAESWAALQAIRMPCPRTNVHIARRCRKAAPQPCSHKYSLNSNGNELVVVVAEQSRT